MCMPNLASLTIFPALHLSYEMTTMCSRELVCHYLKFFGILSSLFGTHVAAYNAFQIGHADFLQLPQKAGNVSQHVNERICEFVPFLQTTSLAHVV